LGARPDGECFDAPVLFAHHFRNDAGGV